MRMEVGVYGQLVNWTSFPCDGDASAAKVRGHLIILIIFLQACSLC